MSDPQDDAGGGKGGRRNSDPLFKDIQRSLSQLSGQHTSVTEFGASKSQTLKIRGGGKDMTKLLKSQVEHAYNELAQKEEDLRLAARIGEQLLEKVTLGLEEISELQEQLQEEEQKREELIQERKKLTTNVKRYRMMLEDVEATNAELTEDLERMQAKLNKERNKKNDNSEDQVAMLTEQVRQLEEENGKLTMSLKSAKKQARESKELAEDLKADLTRTTKELEELSATEREMAQLRAKLEKFEELEERNEEYEEDNFKLAQTVRELTEALERIQRQTEESRRMFHSKQEELDILRNSIVATSASAPALNSQLRDAADSSMPSLADELTSFHTGLESSDDEDDLPTVKEVPDEQMATAGDEKQANPPGGPSVSAKSLHRVSAKSLRRESASAHPLDGQLLNKYSEKPNIPKRRVDPRQKEKEFFVMTLSSVKLNSDPDIFEVVATVSQRELWKKACQLDVPYHKFYKFIEQELTRQYIERIYDQRGQTSSSERGSIAVPSAKAGKPSSGKDSSSSGFFGFLWRKKGKDTAGDSKAKGRRLRSVPNARKAKAAGAALSKQHKKYEPRLVQQRKKSRAVSKASRVAQIGGPSSSV